MNAVEIEEAVSSLAETPNRTPKQTKSYPHQSHRTPEYFE